MAETAQAKFSCPSCGRQFSWKPELAGKSAKCKCGATIKIPAQAPAAPPAAAGSSFEGNPLDSHDFAQTAESAPPAKKGGGGRAAAAAPAADAGLRCPSCGGAMQPGAVICVSCGFNLKTGQRMSTMMGGADPDAAAAAAPRPGVPGPGGYAGPPGLRPARMQEGTNVAGIVKLIVIPLLLIGVVGGAVFGYKKLAGEKDTGPSLGQDRQVRKMMRDDGATELKKWLAEGNTRMLSGMTRQQADGLADRLYDMGAVKVYAFGGVMSLSFAIELPTDPAKRKAIFDWYKSKYEVNVTSAERQKDVGQTYLLVYPGL